MAALGADPERLEIPMLQFVHIVERGEKASMSKRRGDFITLDELIAEIGVDATRFFMLQRSHDSTVDLDLDLAREQSAENPVYYVQYAHARIARILEKIGAERVEQALAEAPSGLELHPAERELVRKLLTFPAEVAEAAARRAPHRIATYALELAPGVRGLLPRLPGQGRRAGGAEVLPDRPLASPPSARSPARWTCSGSALPSRCSQAVLVGVDDRLRAVADAGLGEDVVDVALDGRGAHHERVGDLGVRAARGDQREHLGLARGEVVGQLALGRGGLRRRRAATTWCCTLGSSAASPRATASTAARISSAPASLVR